MEQRTEYPSNATDDQQGQILPIHDLQLQVRIPPELSEYWSDVFIIDIQIS